MPVIVEEKVESGSFNSQFQKKAGQLHRGGSTEGEIKKELFLGPGYALANISEKKIGLSGCLLFTKS